MTFTPKPPTARQAESIDWCLVVRGRVHVAGWDATPPAGLTTLHADNTLHQAEAALETLVPWRDRRLLNLPICVRCERERQEEQDVIEANRMEG